MLRVGTVLHDTYRIDDFLSSGGFGNTYVATNIQFGERCAIKEFFLKGMTERDGNNTTVSVSNKTNVPTFEAQKEKFKKEAVRLRKLSSEHIVRVHDLFEENGTAYYVMDFVDGENLRDQLVRLGHPLGEDTVWHILSQVLDALRVVHRQQLFHLDIKPANLMMDKQGRVILIDFGASKQMKSGSGATTSTAVSYTNGYAPREQMEQNLDKFGPWTDFYALGSTLYTLLTNKKPPMPSDIDDDLSDDKHVALPMPTVVSHKMKALVLWMMATNRMNRPQSVEELSAAVDSPEWKSAEAALDSASVLDDETQIAGRHTVVEAAVHEPNLRTSDSDASENNLSTSIDEHDQEMATEKKSSTKVILLSLVAAVVVVIVGYFLFGGNSSDKASEADTQVQTVSVAKEKRNVKTVKDLSLTLTLGKCRYTGEVISDTVPNGSGEAWYADGRYYKGYFDYGVMHDKHAYFRYEIGDVFEGEIKANLFVQGKYTIKKTGDYFIGTFKNGNPSKGTWYDKHGKVSEVI